MDRNKYDVVVIGAGIAGLSAACELAASSDVVVIEREDQTAYHTTGRSAAMYINDYGTTIARELTKISFDFFHEPPDHFADHSLLSKRGRLRIADSAQAPLFHEAEREDKFAETLDGDQISQILPILNTNDIYAGLYDSITYDIDVHALIMGYLTTFKKRGGQIRTNTEIIGVKQSGDTWSIETGEETIEGRIVVNAAGAWVDSVAGLFGVEKLNFQPRRRTIILIPNTTDYNIAEWPFVEDFDYSFYFRPESGKILISPADETPDLPCDAKPTEFDKAIAVEKFSQVTDMEVETIAHEWAGLRTFSPDGNLVAGWDRDVKGFFWLAGQGGAGIQTAPPLAAITKTLISGEDNMLGLSPDKQLYESLSPARFR